MNSISLNGDPAGLSRIVFFSGQEDEDARRLLAAVQRAIPANRLESFGSLDEFGRRLRASKAEHLVSVLLASDRQELEGMQDLRDLLKGTHVILVIPDQETKTIELAHRLLPRFLRLKCGDFKDLESVLGRIVR